MASQVAPRLVADVHAGSPDEETERMVRQQLTVAVDAALTKLANLNLDDDGETELCSCGGKRRATVVRTGSRLVPGSPQSRGHPALALLRPRPGGKPDQGAQAAPRLRPDILQQWDREPVPPAGPAAAYWLLNTLRGLAPKTSFWRNAQFDTLRLALIKIAAQVTEKITRIKVALPSSGPYKAIRRASPASPIAPSLYRRDGPGDVPVIELSRPPPSPHRRSKPRPRRHRQPCPNPNPARPS